MSVFLLIEDEPNNAEFPSIVVSAHATKDSALIAKEARAKYEAEKIERGIDISWHVEELEVHP